ncbi:hypothetical protein V8C42DRAFT_359176 [Trichoderma barbatum]
MSNPYDSPYPDDDLLDAWQPNNTNTFNLDSQTYSDRPLPNSFSEQVFAEAQSEMSRETLDFLTAEDPFNSDAAIPHEHGLGFDLLFDWSLLDPSINQYSNIPIPDNALLPLNSNISSFPPFDQQLSAGNLPHSCLVQCLDQDHQDNPLSVYPPLGADGGINPSPYGRQVIQQAAQIHHSTTQNPHDSRNNVDLNPNAPSESNNNPQKDPASPARTSLSTSGLRKVRTKRLPKNAAGDTSRDPSTVYKQNPGGATPWGGLTWNGQELFSYNLQRQWLRDRCFNKEQFRQYAYSCVRDTVFWVQQFPSQCGHRLDDEDRLCRYANCPLENRIITAGWLRVAFDEFPLDTSSGETDPLRCAGSVHLYCFEQIFSPKEIHGFHVSGRLRPEDRVFPREESSKVELEKLTDKGIIRKAYQPWFQQLPKRLQEQQRNQASEQQREQTPEQAPEQTPEQAPEQAQEYRDSLSYQLNKYHVDNQTAARQRARSQRNSQKTQKEMKTIDVHLGDLQMFVDITNKTKEDKKRKRPSTSGTRGNDTLNSAPQRQQQQTLTITDPAREQRRADVASWYPEPTQEHSELHELQPRERHLADGHLEESSSRGLGPGYGGHMRPDLAQFYSVGSQYRDPNAFQLNPTPSRQPSYFDPLNPAQNSMRPNIPSPVTTPNTLSSYLQDRHLGVSNPNYKYPPYPTGTRLNRATRGQPRPILRPVITQLYPFFGNPSALVDAFTQTSGETLKLLERSRNTVFYDSRRSSNPIRGGLPIDPRISEDVIEVSQHQQEAVGEANNAFTTHAPTDPVASQLPGITDSAVSPRVTAASPPWHSLVNFDGYEYSGAGFSLLPIDITATSEVYGERAATPAGVSIQDVSSPRAASVKRKNLSPSEATQSEQANKRRRTS